MYPNSVIIGPLLFAFSALGTIRIYCSHLGKKKKTISKAHWTVFPLEMYIYN